MRKNDNESSLAGLLGALRNNSNYSEAATLIKHLLDLKHKFGVFELKVLLLRATIDRWTNVKERDMVLVALGLLEGYYQNTEYIENVKAHETKNIGARREKYLRYGPYVRTKDGKKYRSFDAIPSKKEEASVKNSLGKQDGRLIIELAEYIEGIDNIQQYVDEAVNNPNFDYAGIHVSKGGIKKYFIRLPEQCCFLEDFPPPEDVNEDSDEGIEIEKVDTLEELDEEAEDTLSKESDAAETIRSGIERSESSSSQSESSPKERSFSWFSKTDNTRNINTVISINRVRIDGRALWAVISGVILFGVFVYFNGKNNNFLVPGQIVQVENMIVVNGDVERVLEYISSDPSLATVTPNGLLVVQEGQPGESTRDVDITMRGESGATETKTFTIDSSKKGYDPPQGDINNYTNNFRVDQRMRLVGTEEWLNCVEDAEPGDKVEVRIEYTNISTETQSDVMIKDILPNNLRYIFGTTVLAYGSGTLADFGQDSLFTTGINIGHYEPGINAYVDFTVEVIGNGLPEGSNTLVNWSQCCVNQVTLQDYASVQLYM